MDKKQNIKLDNYKEQYNSVVSNITIKNNELESILEETLKAKTSLTFVQDETAKETRRVETLRVNAGDIESKQQRTDQLLNEKERNLSKRETELELEKQIIAGKKTKREIKADEYVSEKKSEVKDLSEKVIKLDKKLEVGKKEVESQTKTKDDSVKAIKELRDTKRNEEIVLNQKIEDSQESLDTKTKEVSSIEEKLKELYKEEAEAKKRVELPDQMLVERTRVVERKEQNLLILSKRWEKFFAQNFPGQVMKL